MYKCTQGQNISFYLSIRKPQRPGKPYFPGLWGMCAKNFCVSRILREKPGKYEIFFLGFPCFSRLFGYRILRFPRNRGILESWESIPGFSRFFKHKEKPGKRGIFIPGCPYFSGWYSMLSKKPWSPGKPGKLGIIPGFPRFFAHREKPGKRGIFIPGFPRFSRLFRLVSHAFQETAESWKAGNHSWLSALFCT